MYGRRARPSHLLTHRDTTRVWELGSLCYSATETKLLKKFRQNPSVPGAKVAADMDDLVKITLPESARCMKAVAIVTRWLHHDPRTEGVALNRTKSRILLPRYFRFESLPREQKRILTGAGLTVTREGVQLVRVLPPDTKDYERRYIRQ